MTAEELSAEIEVEFEALRQVVDELEALRKDVANREPTVREKTAAAAFLAQFYSGLENVLKRLSRFHGVALPVGEIGTSICSSASACPHSRRCPRCSMTHWRFNSAPSGVSGMSSTTDTDFKSSGIACGMDWIRLVRSWWYSVPALRLTWTGFDSW